MNAWLSVLVGAVLAWTVASGASRIRRLHRLHVRVDAARAGLESALDRRAAAAGGVAGVPRVGGGGPGDREVAENALGRRLAQLDRTGLPPDVRAELDEAELVVALARRVHNDAVRDTLGLRARRTVRWFRLAGTAPMPAYFEIADAAPRPVGEARPVGEQRRSGQAVESRGSRAGLT